jgi:23S rRNA (pseudouridine1915-N3)-methyltransferase
VLHIDVVCVGRLKEPYYEAACREYLKRLSAYARVVVRELPEGHGVLDALPGGAFVAALCVEGELCSSEALAARLAAWPLSGTSAVCFVIGGSEGLPEAVKQRAGWRLSLSPMTFPHHLARVMLLEQLYRGFMINGGGKYHK